MSQIVIGKADGHNVALDLKILLATRLLLTADSGGGKTWLIKRLVEQAFGHVGILIIDPEGEFAPLRKSLDFYLVGKGGDTPADVRSAKQVARALVGANASAVCDIYDMKSDERHAWVRCFLESLIEAPKELRRPYLVVVDEAHMFAPERGQGESEAGGAMQDLCTRGRKRLLCAIFATQRLATLSKNASGMLLNRLIGPTFEDINRKTAARILGIPKSDEAQFLRQIMDLEPGNFYALGRAITRELKLVSVGTIETPHGEEARQYEIQPPPPSAKVRELLAKLGDLPKQAEEEARTVADFKKQIRELTIKLRSQPVATVEKPIVDSKAIERAVVSAIKPYQEIISKQARGLKEIKGLAEKIGQSVDLELARELPKSAPVQVAFNAPIFKANPAPRPLAPPADTNGDLGGPHKKILKALAELRSIGKDRPLREQVAAWAGYSPNCGAFLNPVGNLRSLGYVDRSNDGTVSLTEAGEAIAGVLPSPDQEEVQRRVLQILDGPERKILAALLQHGSAQITKTQLAEESGYAEGGGAFLNPLGALRTKGFIDYPAMGQVQCAEWLFW